MPIEGQATNSRMHKRVVELGYCCRYAFIRMNLRPQDTLSRLVVKLSPKGTKPIGLRTLVRNRAWVRNGKVKCERSDKCLRACWMHETVDIAETIKSNELLE